MINEKQAVIPLLKTDVIVLSGDNECYTVTSGLVTANYELISNQEEADPKFILQAIQITQGTPFKIIIRNPSGDADIIILALSLIADQDKVYIDYDSDKRRKGIWFKDINLKEAERKALIGFHSFTGNDNVPAFFRKGKRRC